MEPQYCAEPSCRKHTEHRGGRFFYCQADKQTYCEDCYGLHTVLSPGRNLWDYYTTNPTGKRQYVGSLSNMRRIEKESGTSNQAANFMSKNWS